MKTLLLLMMVALDVNALGIANAGYDANRILLSPSAARTIKFNMDNRVAERSAMYRLKRNVLTVKLK